MDSKKLANSIAMIQEALILASDYFEGRCDIAANEHGIPEPNEELVIHTEIQNAFQYLEHLNVILKKQGIVNA